MEIYSAHIRTISGPDKILSVPYKDLIQIKLYLAIYGLDLVLAYIRVISVQFFLSGPDINPISASDMAQIWNPYLAHIWNFISGPYLDFE